MPTIHTAPVHWRDCQFVTAANAARIAGRDAAWVLSCLSAGTLEGYRLPAAGGAWCVSSDSLARLLDRAERIDPATVEPSPRGGRKGAPVLRLVVDNR